MAKAAEKRGEATAEPSAFIRLTAVTRFDESVGRFVAGSPELDVWSSGDSEKEALDRSAEAIELFLDEATRMGTLRQVLEDCGISVTQEPTHLQEPLFSRLRHALNGEFTFPLQIPLPTAPFATTG